MIDGVLWMGAANEVMQPRCRPVAPIGMGTRRQAALDE